MRAITNETLSHTHAYIYITSIEGRARSWQHHRRHKATDAIHSPDAAEVHTQKHQDTNIPPPQQGHETVAETYIKSE